MLSSNLVSSFYYNNFAAAISEPFTSLNAYRAGVIDANGNILKPESSIDPFEYLIIKLKRIFAELPPGVTKSKLSSYIPALQLFSEEAASFGMDKEHVDLLIEGFITAESNGEASYIELVEDMGSANLGGPASSPTANTGSVTGFDLPLGGILKRKPQQSVLGFEKQACEMYDVCPEDFDLLSNPNLKAWDEVPDSETKRSMQRSQRRNGGSTIIIRDTGTNRYHKVNLMPRNLSKMFEDVDLSIFKTVLCEQEAATKAYQDDPSQRETNVAVETNQEERRDLNNPEHVTKMAEEHLENLQRINQSASKNPALKGAAAKHEVRTRMAMTAIGMHDASLDDTGEMAGVAQGYFEQISDPSYTGKKINDPGKDFVPYTSGAKKSPQGTWEFGEGESKYRPSGRVSLSVPSVLSLYPGGKIKELATLIFGGMRVNPETGEVETNKQSTIRHKSPLFKTLTQGSVGPAITGMAEKEISRGYIPHALQVRGGVYTPTMVFGKGLEDFASYLATHVSRQGTSGVKSIRPQSRGTLQTEFGAIDEPYQLQNALGTVSPKRQKEIIVHTGHIEHLRKKMLGSNPSEEHKQRVDRSINSWVEELTAGGFYKPDIALRGARMSEIIGEK